MMDAIFAVNSKQFTAGELIFDLLKLKTWQSMRYGGKMKSLLNKVSKLRQRLKANSGKGFTLIELLVAIVILSLVVFPTMQVFITATKTNSKSRTELQATITANSVLESAKAFSIRVFHEQCNGNISSFGLLAGKTENGATKSFAESGGSAGTLVLDTDNTYKIVTGQTFVADTLDVKSEYSYAINGIVQSNNTYDAVVVLKEAEYQDVDLKSTADGTASTYKETDVNGTYSNYNKKFDITVYVYKHASTPVYVGASSLDDNCLVKITGNKLDNAQ
jgi:prepilin-type N-terminal cleavage/methylation domain-containing protein